MTKIAFALFISGLAFGSGPCLASCGPVLLSFIVGTQKNVSKATLAYLFFSLSRISVYLLLGLGVFFLGEVILRNAASQVSVYVNRLGGLFVVLIGFLVMAGKGLKNPWCSWLQRHFAQDNKKSMVILGVVIGLLPCAPLFALFSYIGLVSKSVAESLVFSFSFGLGTLISPLLLLAAFAGFIPRLLKDTHPKYIRALSFICGFIIVVLGVQLIIRTI